MTPPVSRSVLVYDRIAENRRRTVLLVIIAIACVIPFVAAVSFGVADLVAAKFGPHTHMSQAQEQQLRRAIAPRAGEMRYEFERELERRLDQESRARRQQEAENITFRWQAMFIVAVAVTAVLALLFWGLMSSPTSHVLSLCGARPAGAAEIEVQRLLENLAIGAGLPPPKLYVIESSSPNAFAAGMDPAHSVVAVTSGLLKLLDHRELEGVLAHELSHIGNRDTRLNTIVASIALFMRLPYLMRRRRIQQDKQAGYRWMPYRRNYRFKYTVALLPLYVYVFFIAPFLAAAIRAAISRSREFLADADGALLTRFPEGLMRALAKIRGAGSAVPGSNPAIAHLYFGDPGAAGARVGLFSGSLLATHPPIEQRIERLMEYNAGVPTAALEEAVQSGVDFARAHPPVESVGLTAAVTQDELSVLTVGNPMGRVCRALTATPLYDRADAGSAVLARIPAGALLVVFDDPGKFRQVTTHDQTFGYIPATVKLQRVDMLPAEVYDPAARAAAEAQIAARAVAAAAAKTAPVPAAKGGLTGTQIAVVAGFGVAVFAGILLVLLLVAK